MRRSIEHNSVVSIVAGAEKYAYVYNMDQTSIYIDMNPTSTITFSGDTNVDDVQGMTENAFRASAFLFASAKGQKLLPLIVFAGMPNGPVNDELMHHPLHRQRVLLTVQKKGYCDERLILHWIDEVWGAAVNRQQLLLLDSLKTHKMASVRAKLEEEYYREVEFVPPGIPGLAQPMDVAVMHSIKAKCRSRYIKHHLSNEFCSTPQERRHQIAQIVAQAWESIDEETIARGFVKAGLILTGPRTQDGAFIIPEPASE
ncbi:unnamed protein product [Phytophthora fragariaefolia]|uniref:Unnamed protein product n=1 Tax=Phytophthora fragariaefolia TaxID=1490495 RepID=A0A9W7D6Z9_9STRA|nr:unnamed protein product [Phytophthora fragariaefolia]